jgi:predicted nucleotidyltransferase
MKDLVISISKVFEQEDLKFIVIGALARDLFFEDKGIELNIRTKDIDFAILVENWDEFNQVKQLLKQKMRMTEDPLKIYRLMYGGVPIDLIPFGKIAEPGATVNWPGQFRSRMKVQGFKEAFDHGAIIRLESTKVRVVIPEMLVALKLSSWSLATSRTKDAMDVRLIFENIKILCPDLVGDFHHDENEALFEKYNHDELGLWISFLGLRIQKLLANCDLSDYLKNFMNSETTVSHFIRDMNEGNIPDLKLEKKLVSMMTSLKDGIMN